MGTDARFPEMVFWEGNSIGMWGTPQEERLTPRIEGAIRMRNFLTVLAVAVAALIPTIVDAQDIVRPGSEKVMSAKEVSDHLQNVSITIVSRGKDGGEGSGVLKTRVMSNGDVHNYVWTAAHCIDNLRKTRTIIDHKSGSPKVIVEFEDAVVVGTDVQDGRYVGKFEYFAEVVRYSAEEDLALLRVRKVGFTKANVHFFLEKKDGKPVIPALGTSLLHVGSLLGQMGSNSMTNGIMSQHGRLIQKKIFDQTTVTAFPGSSGGGVYLTDGRMIGMLVRGSGETFNLIVPVRRMHEWAKNAGVEWAIDDNVTMPSEEDLRKLPVEDNGVRYSYAARCDEAVDGKNKKSTIRMYGTGDPYFGSEAQERAFPTYFRLAPVIPVVTPKD